MIIKILIIDDHRAIIEGYRSILSFNDFGYDFEITVAHDCESAYNHIVNHIEQFDVILLDIMLPPAPLLNLSSGLDIAKLQQKYRPETKLIILTSHTEIFVLYSILKDIRPAGILVKSDFTPKDFLTAFDRVYKGDTYYSITVEMGIKDILRRKGYLDTYNRQIISLLAKGIQTKNLPQYLNLSISAIDKRKVQIKDYFEIERGCDEDIIREAKKCGYI